MKKLKYILIFLLLVATTLVINGGTKSKPCVVDIVPKQSVEVTTLQGFPDLITFSNYIN